MANLTIEDLKARIQEIHDAEAAGSVTNVAVATILEALLHSDLIELVTKLETDVATCVNFTRTRGQALGIAPLDSYKKVPRINLPDNVLAFGGIDNDHIPSFIDDQYTADYSEIVFNKESRRLVVKTKEGYYSEWHNANVYGLYEKGKGVIPNMNIFYFDLDNEILYFCNGNVLFPINQTESKVNVPQLSLVEMNDAPEGEGMLYLAFVELLTPLEEYLRLIDEYKTFPLMVSIESADGTHITYTPAEVKINTEEPGVGALYIQYNGIRYAGDFNLDKIQQEQRRPGYIVFKRIGGEGTAEAYKPPYLELTHTDSHFSTGEPFTLRVGGTGFAAIERAFNNIEPLAVRVYAVNGSNPLLTSAEVRKVTTNRTNYQIYISYSGVSYVSDLINDTSKEVEFNPVNNLPTGYEQFLVKTT